MPFAGGLAGAAGLIAGGGSLLGGLLGGKKSKQEKDLMAQQLQIAKQQESRAQEQFGISKSYLPQFEKNMQSALNQYGVGRRYYGDILRGGETALDALLGPKRNEVNRAYAAARQTDLNTGPRGGGRNQRYQNEDVMRQGNLIDIALQARPEAVKGIIGLGEATGQVGAQFGNLASAYSGQGNAGLTASSSSLASLLGSEQSSQARRAGSLGDLGEGLGNIFSAIGKKKGWF